MWIKVQVEIHEIPQTVTGKHVCPDLGKRGLRVSAPLLGGKGPRCRDVPDGRVQGDLVRGNECDPAIHHVFREHLFLFDLYFYLKYSMRWYCAVQREENYKRKGDQQVFLFFLDDGCDKILFSDEPGSIFKRRWIGSV